MYVDPDCGFYTRKLNRKDSNTRKFRPDPNRDPKMDPYPESGNPYSRARGVGEIKGETEESEGGRTELFILP